MFVLLEKPKKYFEQFGFHFFSSCFCSAVTLHSKINRRDLVSNKKKLCRLTIKEIHSTFCHFFVLCPFLTQSVPQTLV